MHHDNGIKLVTLASDLILSTDLAFSEPFFVKLIVLDIFGVFMVHLAILFGKCSKCWQYLINLNNLHFHKRKVLLDT